MVDYARCLYKKGVTTVIEKKDFTELEKAGVNSANHWLFVSDVIPNEYKNEIINNSWTNLLATASSLLMYSDKASLRLALRNIKLAGMMFKRSPKARSKFPDFAIVISDLENRITQKLRRL